MDPSENTDTLRRVVGEVCRGSVSAQAIARWGASKEVFLARDIRLDREVALGRVRSTRTSRGMPARVLQEIQTTAQLDEHPHIVTVHDVIQEDDATWIVSQVVRGGWQPTS